MSMDARSGRWLLVRWRTGTRGACMTFEPLTALLMQALAARGRESEAHAAYVRLRGELA